MNKSREEIEKQIGEYEIKARKNPNERYYQLALQSLRDELSKLDKSPESPKSPESIKTHSVDRSKVEVGIAVYGQSGYKIVRGSGNNEIEGILDSINPTAHISRGSGFQPIIKSSGNGVGITVPLSGRGAGGAVPFVSICIVGSNDKSLLRGEIEKIRDEKAVGGDFLYGLSKGASLLEGEILWERVVGGVILERVERCMSIIKEIQGIYSK